MFPDLGFITSIKYPVLSRIEQVRENKSGIELRYSRRGRSNFKDRPMQAVMRIKSCFSVCCESSHPWNERISLPRSPSGFYLLWIFRNFETLPIRVLSQPHQRPIEAMCARQGFVSMLEPNQLIDSPLL